MKHYAYKVVPAPAKGLKGQGIKGPEARYAHAVETLMNEMAADGWEYQRADTLPSTERAGLTGSTTEWRHLLIFRRALVEESVAETAAPDRPELLAPPAVVAPVEAPKVSGSVEVVRDETQHEVTEDVTTPGDATPDEIPAKDAPAEDAPADDVRKEDVHEDGVHKGHVHKGDVHETDETDAYNDEQKSPRRGATQMLSDNGVEDTSEVSGMTSSLQSLASHRNRLKGVTRGDT
ncbi:DUF4177 domain-containing protein [Pseudosulfitobacter koreensis]|uniref:DUF4177 domain-containing protein n=1 Tax=Pseudosulfitobacter koreensis TaxID=2968472 RepID=A0ABT1YZV7_9RHOB|nr:DUF4177 domain-containing protein [Pseudosulfitobacter koreense]MCR8826405.1 DUF4177 domain-containing protein [Pseudosulfitobacter koreense]